MLFKNCHLECYNRVEKPRELTKVELWSQIGSRHFDIMYCINLKIGTRPRFLLNTINIMSFQKVDKSEILEHVQVVPKLFLVLIVVFLSIWMLTPSSICGEGIWTPLNQLTLANYCFKKRYLNKVNQYIYVDQVCPFDLQKCGVRKIFFIWILDAEQLSY